MERSIAVSRRKLSAARKFVLSATMVPAVAECVWVGAAWLGVPENDFNGAYIANGINAANIIFGGER